MPAVTDARLPIRWVVWAGIGWLVVVAGWLIADGAIVMSIPGSPAAAAWTTWAIPGLVVAATIGYGALLGQGRRSVMIWFAALVGALAQILSYILVTVITAGPHASLDVTAGLILLALPVFVMLAALLWIGAGTAAVVRQIRTRSKGRSPRLK
ncbi:hypothetical protein LK09_14970 [Microbacterium mangrovi]|uniref:Uncharacterized protein n=1 Tax=Microbacterium mangrovi TaxID=1348253 RepID=A0A0B2A0S5_9MICO|nr:hypothetical protein [Microbacterium mangrovi]KHK96621.1 hypothetical protein LK09_14970 [Microbacterium mangrovi]